MASKEHQASEAGAHGRLLHGGITAFNPTLPRLRKLHAYTEYTVGEKTGVAPEVNVGIVTYKQVSVPERDPPCLHPAIGRVS